MKRRFILLPIALTTLTPMMGMVGCKDKKPEIHKVKIDSSSDTDDINVGTPEIVLNQQLTIPYEIINPTEKELDVDNSWIMFDSTSYPLNQYDYNNNVVIIPQDQVTTYDVTICLKSMELKYQPIEIKHLGGSAYVSDEFDLLENKSYKFWLNGSPECSYFIFDFGTIETGPVDVNVSVDKVIVNGDEVYYWDHPYEDVWGLSFIAPASSNWEIYLKCNEEIKNIQAGLVIFSNNLIN